MAHLQSKKAKPTLDEYQRYISTPMVEDITSPIVWWCEETQQNLYPNLSQMALDLLSLPSSAADAERLFSSAKLTVTARRNRLQIKQIEALESLKSWLGVDNWYDEDNIVEAVEP